MTGDRPIRVSFVIDNLGRAGTETQLVALIRHLDRSVVEPTLVLLDGENDESRSLEPDCPVLRLGVRRLLGVRSVAATMRLRRVWRQDRPDVAQFYFLDSAYFGIPVAKLCRVPRIVRVRNNLGYWRTRKHRFLERLVRPFVDVTLTNSDTGREHLLNEGLQPKRVMVIENGVELASGGREAVARCEGPVALRPPLASADVGCVANLRPVKNLDGLIRATRIVSNHFPQTQFAVAGEGELRAELEQLRDSLGLGDRFRFLGSVADVPAFLTSFPIAVLPSHSEGMSNALLEYMAAGKAVVATDVGANRTVVGDTGVLVPPGDDAALATALCDLIADPARAATLGAAARARVEAKYSRPAMARRFEQFYFELVNSSAGRIPLPLRIPDTVREAG